MPSLSMSSASALLACSTLLWSSHDQLELHAGDGVALVELIDAELDAAQLADPVRRAGAGLGDEGSDLHDLLLAVGRPRPVGNGRARGAGRAVGTAGLRGGARGEQQQRREEQEQERGNEQGNGPPPNHSCHH